MRRPTIRQVYALAHALCVRDGITFPLTFTEMSYVIEAIRREIGHPEPELEDSPRRPQPRWRRRLDRELHDEIVDELLAPQSRRRRKQEDQSGVT
jgi:hypothetical protein